MNGLDFMKSPWLYVEIEQRSLKVLNGEGGLDFPLERQENGRLTRLCREQLTRSLCGALKRKRWQPRMRALCAIGARGVSLRRLTLPSATNEEFQRLLRLQIESEFPLPPDQLAWGYRRVTRQDRPSNGANFCVASSSAPGSASNPMRYPSGDERSSKLKLWPPAPTVQSSARNPTPGPG